MGKQDIRASVQNILACKYIAPMGTGLEKGPISPWLVTLLHICGLVRTPQSPISLGTPCQYHQKLRASADIATASADVAVPSADVAALSGADIVALNGKCFMMFHNVLRVFHVLQVVHVLLVVHDLLWCITMFYKCLMMFYNVLRCLVSRATIGIGDRRLPQESAITPEKSAMTPQVSSISPRKWSNAKLHPDWRLD